MRKLSTFFAATAAMSAALVAPALAQPIAVGGAANGTLTETDQVNAERDAYMDTYELRLNEGQAVDIHMSSDEFDSYLIIGTQQADYFEPLDYNDDFPTCCNSRLRFLAPATGTYVIQATTFSSRDTGTYALSVAETVIVPPPNPIALSLGNAAAGAFASNSPTLDESGQAYAIYTIEGREGEMISVDLTTEAFDGYVEIGMDTEWGYEAYAAGGDYDGEASANVLFRFPVDGVYTVRALSLNPGSFGEFTVTASAFTPAPEPRPTRLRMNSIMRGQLVEGEVLNQNMQIYDVYSINVREGQEVRITMRASDAEEYFDPFLEVGVNTPLGFASAAMDDDGGGGINGLDAQVEFTAQSSGTLIIRATGLQPMTGGSYTISVE
jgi:hypothetical protein